MIYLSRFSILKMRAFFINSTLLLFRYASEKSTPNRSQATNEQSPMVARFTFAALILASSNTGLLFALTSSTITLWAIIGLIALAITIANKDNEKTPNGRIVGLVKGMLAATIVLSFFTILATAVAFVYYTPFM